MIGANLDPPYLLLDITFNILCCRGSNKDLLIFLLAEVQTADMIFQRPLNILFCQGSNCGSDLSKTFQYSLLQRFKLRILSSKNLLIFFLAEVHTADLIFQKPFNILSCRGSYCGSIFQRPFIILPCRSKYVQWTY